MKVKCNDINHIVKDAKAIARIFQKIYHSLSKLDKDKEHIWVAGLTGSNELKFIELISTGGLSCNVTTIREVLRPIIVHASHSIICIHNHPQMRDTTPSNSDISFTRKLIKACDIFQICCLDHIIITERDYFSCYKNREKLHIKWE